MWPTYLPQYALIQDVSSHIYCYTLDSLLPHWDDLQNYAVVHAAGSPDPACVFDLITVMWIFHWVAELDWQNANRFFF